LAGQGIGFVGDQGEEPGVEGATVAVSAFLCKGSAAPCARVTRPAPFPRHPGRATPTRQARQQQDSLVMYSVGSTRRV
jgi:hypothetical protein